MVWETGNVTGFGRAIRIEFEISRQRDEGQYCTREEQPRYCIRFLKGSYERLLSILGNEDVIWGDTGLEWETLSAVMDDRARLVPPGRH